MKKILIYLLFLSTSLNAQVANNLVEIEKYTIDSKILETERNYWVSLPLNYDSSVAYPVMYVLDAEWKFNITNALELVEQEIADSETKKQIVSFIKNSPEGIIKGI